MATDELHFYLTLFGVYAACFGACVGSFLNVCIYRIPRGESIVRPRSHCPHCNHLIPWYQNIPILSWLCLRGKCWWCKGPISFRYTLVEALTAVLFLAVYLQRVSPETCGFVPLASPALIPVEWLALAGLMLGTFVDFEHYIIPDCVTLGGIGAGLVLSFAVPAMHGVGLTHLQGGLQGILGAAAGFGLLYAIAWLGEKLFKKEAMGFGDVKLMGAIGAFFGWQAVFFVVFVASLVGSVVGLTLMAFGGAKAQSRLPFGPYLSVAAALWMFYGPAWVGAYWKLLAR